MQDDKRVSDTIAAIATASGSGGIGVVRVSGPLVPEVAKAILKNCPKPRQASYLPFLEADGSLIDQGIAIYYQSPNSYTGEDVLELQAHGGPALMQILLARCLALGARQALPGEFTQRAYLNDKMDLAQAEAVADIIQAATFQAAKSAIRSLSGEFSAKIHGLLDRLIELRMYIEACLDFPEEDIDFITTGRVEVKLRQLLLDVQKIYQEAKQGHLLREGMTVVLVGQPNVGKSSLINQLAAEEVAIVTSIAGTTRDTIKSEIQIEGVPVHVVDTAGLRETEDEIERVGIARTWRALENANIALLLVDAAHGITETEKSIIARLPKDLPKVWVHNKIDLASQAPKKEIQADETHIHLSAKSGEGIPLLKSHLLSLMGWHSTSEGIFMARTRHLEAIAQVEVLIEHALEEMGQAELVAENLRLTQTALASVTGEFTPDDLLGEIFSKFCIGK
jgi:tRNA modification GTPase